MNFIIAGKPVNYCPQASLTRLIVDVFYSLGGQCLMSDKMPAGVGGDYMFGLSDALLADSIATDRVVVAFPFYRVDTLVPSSGGIDRLAAKIQQIEIAVELLAEGATTPREAESYRIASRVTRADGKADAALSAPTCDRDLRSDQQLGKAHTPTQFRHVEKQSADLIVRVLDADGSSLVESAALFTAPHEATPDSVIPSSVQLEFERTTASAKGSIEPEGVTLGSAGRSWLASCMTRVIEQSIYGQPRHFSECLPSDRSSKHV